MLNITIPHVESFPVVPKCTAAQSNIFAAHMIALQYACSLSAPTFALFERDIGTVHRELENLPYPKNWCVINVCPTNSAEPTVPIRPAVSPYDFGAVAVVYRKSCVCTHLRQLWKQFTNKCEPFDSIVYRLPHSYRTGVMWIEHVYKPSSHSDGWAHRQGKTFVAAARRYWQHT